MLTSIFENLKGETFLLMMIFLYILTFMGVIFSSHTAKIVNTKKK